MSAILTGSPGFREARSNKASSAYSPFTEMFKLEMLACVWGARNFVEADPWSADDIPAGLLEPCTRMEQAGPGGNPRGPGGRPTYTDNGGESRPRARKP